MANIHHMTPIIGETYHSPLTGDFCKVVSIQVGKYFTLVGLDNQETWNAADFLRCYIPRDPSNALAED
jgi:hypothetical protein